MNREIKFRAFSKYNNMCHYSELGKLGEFFTSMEICPDEIIFQQYTGLKDKNGKEIFEGDLIRQGNTLFEIRNCIGGFECQIWQEYKYGGAEEGSCYNFSCLSNRACEIIGNIYQHPELINNNG